MQIKNPTDSLIMVKIIEWMISETTNKRYHEKLMEIIQGLKSKRWMEEENNPTIKSIILFGYDIFLFDMKEYREIVKKI